MKRRKRRCPSRKEILEACEQIQAGWTAEEREKRRVGGGGRAMLVPVALGPGRRSASR